MGDAAPAEPEVRMSLGDHLAELRSRLLKSIAALGFASAAALYFQQELMDVLVWPHRESIRMLREGGLNVDPRFIDMTYGGPFMTYLKIALIFGAFLASPLLAYQIWRFVAAGLYRSERRFVLTYAPFSFVLFVAGCLFGYFVLIRYGLYFLASYADPGLTSRTYNLGDYVDFVIVMTLIMGLTFQLPLVMMFFSRIGIVDPVLYSRWRRAAIVGIVALSGILTPSVDVVSQLAMAFPLWLLYELGILLARASYHAREPAAGPATT